MPSRPRSRAVDRIESLMEQVSEAMLHTRWFDAERTAVEAMSLARRASDFLAMARICLPLQEARRNRLSAAFDVGERVGVQVYAGSMDDDAAPEPGCWLVIPPLVGVDARRLRVAALAQRVPAALLCREPTTRTGRWPVVAVGRVVVRVHLEAPPECAEAPLATAPPLRWFIAALEALGDAAMVAAQQERDATKRVDALLDRLDAHPDHEKLHQALADACREAHAAAPRPGAEGPRRNARLRSADEDSLLLDDDAE